MMNKETVMALLAEIKDENSDHDLVSAGTVREVGIHEDRVSADIRLGYHLADKGDQLAGIIKARLESAPEIDKATVNISSKVMPHKVQDELKPLESIANIIAVGSGKGGVGKSTTAVNLAVALQREGARVGLLDADIYGPSIPSMLGVKGQPSTDGEHIIPKQAHGLKVMSIGFLVEEDSAMIWRGPMVTSALQQLLGDTLWGPLDYLIIDLPPGTGDIQLTLAQRIPVAGAVIVTTPQDIALQDARRAVNMFRKVDVPVLGVVENMSTHICTACGHEEAIFGSGGGEQMAMDFELPLLGRLPLAMEIRSSLDEGKPIMVQNPDSPLAGSYQSLALRAAGELSIKPRSMTLQMPEIVIQS
ncbi:MAG: iron-sulfur cluster carrier protein ApbC [Gammaproteobacteria bacterium]|nr:iron-sulfur cluster carrier protein ApbC [Gammaproteobacteria bacterium]